MKTSRPAIFKDSTKRIASKDLLSMLCEIIDAVSDEDSTELAEVA